MKYISIALTVLFMAGIFSFEVAAEECGACISDCTGGGKTLTECYNGPCSDCTEPSN